MTIVARDQAVNENMSASVRSAGAQLCSENFLLRAQVLVEAGGEGIPAIGLTFREAADRPRGESRAANVSAPSSAPTVD
jgi:hypothetical protein